MKLPIIEVQESEIRRFEEWFKTLQKRGKKNQGAELSKLTLDRYKRTLKKVPDYQLTPTTNPVEALKFYRNIIAKWHTFKRDPRGRKPKYEGKTNPPVVYAIRTYLRMLEEDPELEFVANFVRTKLKAPVSVVAAKNQESFIEKALTKEEVRTIIKHSKDPKLTTLLQLLYDTGARISELASVRLENIDFSRREIRVKGKGGYIRYLSFERGTVSLLKRMTQHTKAGILFGESVDALKWKIKEHCKSAANKTRNGRFAKVSAHWFRHTRATHLSLILSRTKDLQTRMGWNTINMADVYVTNSADLLRNMSHYKSTDLWEE